jgi:hypothetical protein
MDNLQLSRLTKNLRDTLRDAIRYTPPAGCLVLFDTQSELARLLTAAYRANLPDATFVDFAVAGPDECIAHINSRKPGDLVVLVQSANFRLNEFRLRLELFKRDLKTIEHSHVGRQSSEQFDAYIDELAYDATYYRSLGASIKAVLDAAKKEVVIECHGGTRLVYAGKMEEAKLNVGDYSGMKNVGGSFPIGEVFTEACELYDTNGELMVFGYGDMDHHTRIEKPFKAIVKNGILDAPDAPSGFTEILDLIRKDEDVLVRELGLGLNPAVSKTRIVNDVMSFERQYGMHVSLGKKHAMYKKPGLAPKHTKYHLDIFIDISRILVDGVALFENGKFVCA